MSEKHLFNPTLFRIALVFVMLIICFGVTLVQADDPHRVGLVVVHGNGR